MRLLGGDLHHLPPGHDFFTIAKVEKQAALKNIADLLVLVLVSGDNSPFFHIDAGDGHAFNMHDASGDFRPQFLVLNLIPTMDSNFRRHRATLPPIPEGTSHIIQARARGITEAPWKPTSGGVATVC